MEYQEFKELTESFRESWGIKLPKEGSQKAIVLCYLAGRIGQKVTKAELTQVVADAGIVTNDVQSGRHLKRDGWWIDNKKGVYTFVTMSFPHPVYETNYRRETNLDWDGKKKAYGWRCATCGELEGTAHRYYHGTVELQKGHKDPTKEMSDDNIIPQCQFCNQQDRNRWVYDNNGRVIGPNNLEYMVNYLKKNNRIDELKELL